MSFVIDDGGRRLAGFTNKRTTGDCVPRAIAIASGLPYAEVYAALAEGNASQPLTKRMRNHRAAGARSASMGIWTHRKWFKDYMVGIGFEWVPTMQVGQGCTVHLRADELPLGRLVVSLSKHYTAMIDGVIHDAYDPSRGGTRCVYGYWKRG